jgi:hypothetical protein
MRTKAIIPFLFVVCALFSGCNRPSDSGEVQRLREEVERLKSAQQSPPPATTPAAESPDYQNFLRVARRLMTAIESGTSFQDFHERAVDVLASAKEASRSASTPTKQKAIATFATAIIDANDIWGCKSAESDYLRYYDEGHGVMWTGSANCGRWDVELPKLVAAYKLDTHEPGYPAAYSGGTLVKIDLALKKIFKFCGQTFEILEAPE